MKRILFVDGDERSLAELEDILDDRQDMWNMSFLSTAEEALSLIDGEGNVDLVVSSIKLNGTDGIEFLGEVKKRRPQIVRFALGEESNREQLLAASNLAHQFIEKPFDGRAVRNIVARTLILRERLRQCPLREQLIEMGALPSLPSLYDQVRRELQSPDASVASVAAIVAKDVSMSAKVLQVANSAAVGLRHHVTDITQAATLLGLQRLSTLLLMVEAFSMKMEESLPPDFSLESLWAHSLTVAEYSKKIAEANTDDPIVIDASFTGGLLHDVGMIIIASSLPSMLKVALSRASANDISLYEAEKEVLGATHTEVGGYLLDLWGLPDLIVEAIAFHDFPSSLPEEDYFGDTGADYEFSPLTAVHVANYFCEDERRMAYGCAESELDSIYLQMVGGIEQIEDWWAVCQED